MMEYKIAIVRAFTQEGKNALGNPAGVLVSKEMLSPEEMAEIAIEAGQPITSFLTPRQGSKIDYDLRYYDLGGRECHICGHATVAATKFLLGQCPDLDGSQIEFHLNPELFNGEEKKLHTRIDGERIEIDLFPSNLRKEDDPALLNKVASVLKVSKEEILSVSFSTNVRDYVVGLRSPETLLYLEPDFAAMKKMAESGPYQHEGLMVSCPAPDGDENDLLVRVFLPITGVNEDIACGSGNCSIIPYWFDRGMNVESRSYKATFPFPQGPAGFVGGIQTVLYDIEEEKITIISEAKDDGSVRVELQKKSGQRADMNNGVLSLDP